MAPNRLYVDEILSIGLVGQGDNPESEVLLWKSREEPREPSLNDYRQQLEDIRKERLHDQEVDKIQHRRKDNMPSNTPMTDNLIVSIKKDQARARGEEVPDNLDETVKKKLDAWAGRRQIEREMSGKWGAMSTPRPEQRVKLRAAWWQSPDGIAVKELLREKGAAADPELILKSHSEASAAIARLDA